MKALLFVFILCTLVMPQDLDNTDLWSDTTRVDTVSTNAYEKWLRQVYPFEYSVLDRLDSLENRVKILEELFLDTLYYKSSGIWLYNEQNNLIEWAED